MNFRATHVRPRESVGTACVVVVSATRFESFFLHVRARESEGTACVVDSGSQFESFFFVFFCTYCHARTATYSSIYNSSNLCVSVCLRPLFLDNHWSDLIETCQVYCWGPEDVPFECLILIGQAVPKLWPFIYETNDRTRCYDITIDVTILLFLFFCTIDVTILLLRLI